MKKVIVATLVAALGASAWADFTKVQESFEDNEGTAWIYSADGYWFSSDTAASENITTVAYGSDAKYTYGSPDGNTAADTSWPGDKYLNLAKATNLSRNFAKDGEEIAVSGTDGYVLDTLVAFTATEAEDAPTLTENDKFLIWLEETELEAENDGEVTYSAKTNLIIKCGNDTASSTNDFTLLTSSGTLPVKAGEWARVSVKAIPLYANGPLGFVVYINGAAVVAGESDEIYQALFTKADSLTDSAKGYYELKQIFPSLTSSTSLTAVDFKGTGKIDDFQLVAADDDGAPAFTADPVVITAQSVGLDSEKSKSLQMKKGMAITEEVANAYMLNQVEGYTFVGWYTDEKCETKVVFPYTITGSVTFYAKFNVVVAKIGEIAYGTFQEAIDAAVDTATAASPVQIDIARDFTIDSTIKLLGKGKDVTNITINNEKWIVTFNTQATAGFTIDDATVTFEGEECIWKNPFETIDGKIYAKTMFCVGEVGKTVDGVKKLAPADVIINSGTYISHDSHIFNIQNGSATVNGGSFEVENYSDKFCFRAEDSEVKDAEGKTLTGGSAALVVKGGTFKIPTSSAGLPVGNKADAKNSTTKILATGTAKFKCAKKCLTGEITKYGALGSYLVTEKESGYDSTSEYAFTLDSDGYYYAAPKVVTIGEVGYASLQDAIDAAIEASTADNEVTIDIVKDITITDTVSLTGKGIDSTKIILNANEGVTISFDPTDISHRGFTIDNATVTFNGKGAWTHVTESGNPKTMICIGEMGVTDGEETKIGPAYVVINEGTFSANLPHIFNVQAGVVRVNGGTFEVKTAANKCCFRVEDFEGSATDKDAASSLLIVAGGTFATPIFDATVKEGEKDAQNAPPVAISRDAKNAELHILVTSGAKFKCAEVCLTDNMKKFESMDGHFSVEGTDAADGNTTYTHTDDYKFVKGEDEYWTIKEITKAVLTVTWDEGKVVSFKLSDDEDVIETKDSYSVPDYDVDDASEVSVVKDDIVFSTGWTLDEEKSTLGPVTMTEARTLYIAAKLKYEPVDPEATSTTYTDETKAQDLADAINSNKVDMITSPDISAATFFKSDYVKLFEAKVNGDATSGYTVSVVLTKDAKDTIQEQVDEVFTAKGLDLSTLATEGASFTATATPGLYYTVLSGTDVKEITTMSTPVLAESTQVELTLPKKDGNCGFYQIQVDVKKPTSSAE